MSAGPRRRGVGCLPFLLVYGLTLAVMLVLTAPPEQRGAELETVRHRFLVAVVLPGAAGTAPEIRGLTLARLDETSSETTGATFLLPAAEIVIEQGDIHRAVVVEDHGDWQLVEYHYANTITSTSRYRAYADRVEPVAYRVTSHVGQAMYAMFMLVPAYGLTLLLTWWWRRRRDLDTRADD